MHNTENSISGPLDFKIFWGGGGEACAQTPLEACSYSKSPLNKYCCQYEHPSKNLSYAPALNNFISIITMNRILMRIWEFVRRIELSIVRCLFRAKKRYQKQLQCRGRSLNGHSRKRTALLNTAFTKSRLNFYTPSIFTRSCKGTSMEAATDTWRAYDLDFVFKLP